MLRAIRLWVGVVLFMFLVFFVIYKFDAILMLVIIVVFAFGVTLVANASYDYGLDDGESEFLGNPIDGLPEGGVFTIESSLLSGVSDHCYFLLIRKKEEGTNPPKYYIVQRNQVLDEKGKELRELPLDFKAKKKIRSAVKPGGFDYDEVISERTVYYVKTVTPAGDGS